MQTYDFRQLFKRFHNKEWEKSDYRFLDKEPFSDLRKYGWLAGGAVRRIVSGQPLDSDFDFFFTNEKQFHSAKQCLRGKKLYENEFNETWSEFDYNGINRKVQLINIVHSSVEDLFNQFDFTICQFALSPNSTELFTGDFSMWDLARKRLVPHNITRPISSMRRVLKYSNQGFYACAGCLRAILEAAILNPASLDETQYID